MIAESFLASGPHQIAPEGRAVMLVHLGSERTGETNSGPPIPDATLRRLACDAGIIRVHEDGSVGRRSRAVPRPLRRALIRRDRGCRFPACSARRADAHHIEHWADGGETSMRNLVLLCRTHHRLIHEKGFRISARAPGEFEFFRPDGRNIETPTTSGSVAQLRQAHARTDIDPQTAASLGDERRPDYGIAVSGLFALEHKT